MNSGAANIMGSAYRIKKDGWTYVHTEGEPLRRGIQHGYLLAEEIMEYLKMIKLLCRIETGRDFKFLCDAARMMFIPKLGKELAEEVRGITEGLKLAGFHVEQAEIAALNGYTELVEYWLPSIQSTGCRKFGSSGLHGSAFIASGSMTKDGGIVMGHNSAESYITGRYKNIVFNIKSKTGKEILMQAAPGHIGSSGSFFVSSGGIIGAGTAIEGFLRYDMKGIPEFIRQRKAMEQAGSIEEWVKIMSDGNNGGCTSDWLLGNVNTGEIACFEQGLKYAALRKGTDRYFAGFNMGMDPKIHGLECNGSGVYDIRKPWNAQKARWEQFMAHPGNQGKVDTELAKKMISDHYDAYLNRDNHPCSRTICQHCELDACEFLSAEGTPVPYQPSGSVSGKVIDSGLAKNMSFTGRFGSPCGTPFEAEEFLPRHAIWNWQREYLKDIPAYPWVILASGMH